MSRRKGRKGKKGMNPAVAVVLFVACGGVAGNAMLGALGPASPPSNGAPAENLDASVDVGSAPAADKAAIAWRDLLAVHGSFDLQSDVRLAFATPLDKEPRAAAPAAEIKPPEPGVWIGDDPPRLRLGVVMVSAGAARAVLGGRVVGVGDRIDAGRVAAIEPGRVTLEWNGRRLNYELAGDLPREFQPEVARRAAEQAAKAAPANAATTAAPDAATAGEAAKDQKADPAGKAQGPDRESAVKQEKLR